MSVPTVTDVTESWVDWLGDDNADEGPLAVNWLADDDSRESKDASRVIVSDDGAVRARKPVKVANSLADRSSNALRAREALWRKRCLHNAL